MDEDTINAAKREAERQERIERAEDGAFRRRVWRSLKTAAGWATLALIIGASMKDIWHSGLALIGRR